MTLPAAKWHVIYNVRIMDDDLLISEGPFEILYSRRCSGQALKKRFEDEEPERGYGIAMDILIPRGTVLKIIRDGKERRYE